MRFNFRAVLAIQGILAMLLGGFMFLCLPVSYIYQDGTSTTFILSGTFAIVAGFSLWFYFSRKEDPELKKKDGYLVVTFGWLSMAIFGAVPYIISGTIPIYADAFFETMSGFTTTGASILTDIEALPYGILMWRSLTQWIGGMGIIVLAVAILPLLGIGGMQLFVAEAPGVSPDKLKPRIRETAIRLWLIYLILTISEFILLVFGGMGVFDAINHSLTTMATGGFSTKNASIAHFSSPFIQYVITIFMFLAGTNFTLTYFGMHGQIKKIFKNDEFRYYLVLVVFVAVLVSVLIYNHTDQTFELSFRQAFFSVISIISTTGYVVSDYTAWAPLLTTVFFMLMFVGASAGSTAGGVKIVRHVILVKNSILEFKRLIHRSAVLPVRFNNKAVTKDITFNIMAFMIIYIMVFALGSIIMSYLGADFITAMGAVATSVGNIGPGFGKVGPVSNFSEISIPGKWFLSFLMLLGRLELFTVLILFTPYFWRKY
ncbi:TrkH family potassium uptake protein [Bacteroidota bacterium]